MGARETSLFRKCTETAVALTHIKARRHGAFRMKKPRFFIPPRMLVKTRIYFVIWVTTIFTKFQRRLFFVQSSASSFCWKCRLLSRSLEIYNRIFSPQNEHFVSSVQFFNTYIYTEYFEKLYFFSLPIKVDQRVRQEQLIYHELLGNGIKKTLSSNG